MAMVSLFAKWVTVATADFTAKVRLPHPFFVLNFIASTFSFGVRVFFSYSHLGCPLLSVVSEVPAQKKLFQIFLPFERFKNMFLRNIFIFNIEDMHGQVSLLRKCVNTT